MRRLALLAASVLVAAAAPAAAQGPGDPPPPDPSIADGTAQAKLDAARATWVRRGFSSYSEQLSLSCFCPPADPETVVVKRGTLTTKVSQGVRAIATVPRQFKVIQRAIDDGYSGLTVRYGPRGAPTRIALDPSALTADEESSYTLTRLRRR